MPPKTGEKKRAKNMAKSAFKNQSAYDDVRVTPASQRVRRWTDSGIDSCTDGGVHGRADGRAEDRTDGRADGGTAGRTHTL